MWKPILTFLLKFAISQLGADVDAETQRRVDEYNQKRNALEEKEKQSEVEIRALEESIAAAAETRKGYAKDLAIIEKQCSELDEKIRSIRDEKDKKLADIQRLDDDALLHSKL